jgi:hypothetical protein
METEAEVRRDATVSKRREESKKESNKLSKQQSMKYD